MKRRKMLYRERLALTAFAVWLLVVHPILGYLDVKLIDTGHTYGGWHIGN